MAIAFLFELGELSTEQAATVLRELDLGGKPAPGQVLHVEGPMEGGGTRVVDVWESEAAFQSFAQEKLVPIMQRLGVQVPGPRAVWPVTAVIK
jgi:hypothetical protein